MESRKNKYMFYPRFTKVIINHFMSQDQSIPRRNKVDWHMANDDPILTTMRFIPQHEVVQRYSAILPDYLTNPAMKESEAYKIYHDLGTRKVLPKPKYVRRSSRTKTDETAKPSSGKRVKTTAKVAKSGKKKQLALGLETLSDIALTEAEQMKLSIERSKTQIHLSQPSGSGTHEGTGVTPGVPDVPTYESDDEQISWKQEEVNEEDSFDPRVQTPSHVESTDDDNSDEEVQGANTEEEEMETEDTHVILTAPIIPEGQQQSSSVSSGFVSNMLNPRLDIGIDSIFNLNIEATSLVDVLVTTIAELPLVFAITLPPPPTPLITRMQQTPVPTSTIVPSTSRQDLPNFGSLFGFDHRLKTLETDFSEFKQMNQFAKAVSSILGIVDAYLANKMNESVKTVVQLQSNRIRDEAQAKNKDFLNKLDDNIKKIIKDQVKQQVKTSLAIAANLSELELKKILIEKIESNKSINRSNEQNNLYKALVEAYESDKLILDTYGDTVLFKRRKDDKDKDEEPSAGLNQGSKRKRAGKEPKSTSVPKEKTSKTTGKSNEGQENPRKSFDELTDTPFDFLAFVMNRLNVETLTPELLASPTFELMKGTCKSLIKLEYFFEEVYKATTEQLDWHNPEGQQYHHDLRKPLPLIPNSRGRQVIPFDHFINNDLAYLCGGVSSRTYATSVIKTKGISHWGSKRKQFYGFAVNRESARNVYSRHDDKLHTFKEGDFKRFRLQDVEDMLLLLVQGKLTNLNVEERLAFSVSLRLFTRSIVIQRRIEDLQLAYSAYFNPRGFIYQNRDKKNKLMRVDELHKFSDGTLNDVRTALDDCLKGIRMEYLPQTIWRQSDMEREKAMIQAIDKQLKSRRIMRSLERFVGGRPYEASAAAKPCQENLRILPDHRSIYTDQREPCIKVNEFQRSFRHSDSQSGEVLKLKNFKKDATLKLFKSTNQEMYEHVGPEVTSSQDGKVNKMAK
ncbi:hypothetical protein Tco_1448657 [Tanacetum coccineum]